MIIKKINELIVSSNDIYILNIYKNHIIINDNYQGLILLNHALQVTEKIFILQHIHIYHLYQKYNDSSVLIYSPESEKFILVDINTKKHVVIRIPTNDVFSPNYYWDNNILVMTTFNDDFYQLSYIWRQISREETKKICSSFFYFWNVAKNYSVLKFYSEYQAFITQSDAEMISFFSCAQLEPIQVKNFDDGWHDVEFNNRVFMFIHEKKIEIFNCENKITLKPCDEYIFLRAKFLNNNHIIILSSKPSNSRECLLENYYLQY